MLRDVPLSAYLICYGPLVITLLGFIVFAFMTDGNARRTYLRRKIGTAPLGDQVNTRTRALTVETPAGAQLTVQPLLPAAASPALLPSGGGPALVVDVPTEGDTSSTDVAATDSTTDNG
jgi:hypothetical protein